MIKIKDPNPQNAHYKNIFPFWDSNRDRKIPYCDDELLDLLNEFSYFLDSINGENPKYTDDIHSKYYNSNAELMDFIEMLDADYTESIINKEDTYIKSRKINSVLLDEFLKIKKNNDDKK